MKIIIALVLLSVYFDFARASTCPASISLNNTFTFGPISFECGNTGCFSSNIDIYNPLISITSPYLTGNYSNCQPASNISISNFNNYVLDLTKCNTTYQVNSTSVPGLYAKVTLTCTKSSAFQNVSLNGIILLLVAFISFNYSKI